METTFKAAENSDIETLIKFVQEFCQVDNHPFDDLAIRAALNKILNDDYLGRVWLIQRGKEAIGYVVLTFGYSLEYRGRDAFIDEFYIRESYRGQGIGTMTLQFVESVCPSLEIQALHLEVEKENTAAKRLYFKAGFKEQERYLMTKWTAN